ncbi:hypothetical protein FE257_004925 [Aspergillus nanangensis]|uniref:Uncharacterized protein n=1 Tax=Aspergillus nanangensis TaxID=2582783 RepID=A0AAD4CBN2_ASPNN|nr:hypothetical protein FE257_004925 [Aspergillus nanangensis]
MHRCTITRGLKSDAALQEYVESRLRYDYDPRRSLLTIRMPIPLHEILCAEVAGEITRQLELVRDSAYPEAEFAKEIKPFASSRIKLPETLDDGKIEYIIREPDASFGHYMAQFPGVVIEICYSQKNRDIRNLVDDYILCSEGSINAVVCIDIEYRDSKQASVTLWRPAYNIRDGVEVFEASPVMNQETFRTRDGEPSNINLRLKLNDFATIDLTKDYPGLHKHEIVISSTQLCEFLSRAELRQETQERHAGSTNSIRPGVQKRRRPVTPESDSLSEDGPAKRGHYDDSEYLPSSSPVGLDD